VSQLPSRMEAVSDAVVSGSLERADGERKRIADAPARPAGVPDPELAQRGRRRRFTAQYKLRIVREADACSRPGEVGALLRREGLYSSLLTEWRRARDSGALEALEPKPRGPRGASPERVEVVALRRQLDRSQADLETARRVIEVQGNVCALLEELLSKSATPADEQPPPR
jgi:transposase